MIAPQVTLTGSFDPEQERTWRHVPFIVPEGVDQIWLTIAYNDQVSSDPMLRGGNTLDIGLFDERGIASGGPGFRGWSGSNKLDLVVGTDWATPPYRAGKPGAGEWNVLLGPYKIGPRGLDYRIEIRFNVHIPAPPRPRQRALSELTRREIRRPDGWYCGDLHMHTVFSDGDSWPHELAARAYEIGLDFIGITDHNRAQSPLPFVPQEHGWPVLVPGVEVTTYAGHFNVWGTDTWYDFRDPTPTGIQAAVDVARAGGAYISLNHPKPFGPNWEYPEITGFDAIEAWNGWWNRLNTISLRYWHDRLAAGERLWALGGSDTHDLGIAGDQDNPLSPARLGMPTLWVQTADSLSAEAVLAALRAGRSFISESPTGPQLFVRRDGAGLEIEITGAAPDALVLVGANGIVFAAAIASEAASFTWSAADLEVLAGHSPFVRAEIHGSGGDVRAVSQPVWLT